MSYLLKTDRLQLRELTHEDAPFIMELVNTPGWLKYIGDRNIKTIEQAINYLDNGPIKSYQENSFGLWMVELIEEELLLEYAASLREITLNILILALLFYLLITGKVLLTNQPRLVYHLQRTS